MRVRTLRLTRGAFDVAPSIPFCQLLFVGGCEEKGGRALAALLLGRERLNVWQISYTSTDPV